MDQLLMSIGGKQALLSMAGRLFAADSQSMTPEQAVAKAMEILDAVMAKPMPSGYYMVVGEAAAAIFATASPMSNDKKDVEAAVQSAVQLKDLVMEKTK
jgi:heptaprenylglyceryl phosphate synthase